MVKLHDCPGSVALQQMVVMQTQKANGEWGELSYDSPATLTKNVTKKRETTRKPDKPKKKPKRTKMTEKEDDFICDEYMEEEEEEAASSEEESEEEDEEAQLLRAAVEAVGADEIGVVPEDVPVPPVVSEAKKASQAKKARKKAREAQREHKKPREKQWVQCDACKKWRSLPKFADPEDLPEFWKCEMMQDLLSASRLNCDSAQEPLPEELCSDTEQQIEGQQIAQVC